MGNWDTNNMAAHWSDREGGREAPSQDNHHLNNTLQGTTAKGLKELKEKYDSLPAQQVDIEMAHSGMVPL